MRFKTFSDRKRAFTIIEVLVVIAIFSIVMMAVLELYLNFYKTYAIQNAIINNSYSAGAILNETANLVHQANTIVTSKVFSGSSYTTSSSTLILEIPSITSSGDVVSGKYDYAVMYFASTSLYRMLSADAASSRTSGTKLLSNVVNSFSFTFNSGTPSLATRVIVDLITQSIVKQQTLQTHLTGTVYLRNH